MLNALGTALFTAGIGVSYVLTAVSDAAFPFSKRNYKSNSARAFDGFIYDQTAGEAALLKMGYKNASYNGCGCIAAYNAALLKGKKTSPADIIKYYEKHGGIVLDGVWGVNPLAVKGFLKSIGLCATIRHFPRELDTPVSQAGEGVLTYAHKSGMHFVAVEHKNGMYRVYNEYSGARNFTAYPSLDTWLKSVSSFAVSLILIG